MKFSLTRQRATGLSQPTLVIARTTPSAGMLSRHLARWQKDPSSPDAILAAVDAIGSVRDGHVIDGSVEDSIMRVRGCTPERDTRERSRRALAPAADCMQHADSRSCHVVSVTK